MGKFIYKGPAIGLYDHANFHHFIQQFEDIKTVRPMAPSGSRLFGVYLHIPSSVKVYYLASINLDELQPTAQVALIGNDANDGELERRIRASAIIDHAPAILKHIFDLVRIKD